MIILIMPINSLLNLLETSKKSSTQRYPKLMNSDGDVSDLDIVRNPPKTLEEMRKVQLKLAKLVSLEGEFKAKHVLGVDQAFVGDDVISACVVLDKDMNVVDRVVHVERTEVPYIPTYLMFREGSSAVNAVKKAVNALNADPDEICIMVDGSGIAHPRRCGLATFIGLATGIQSVGVTKSRLYGYYREPEDTMEANPLIDEVSGEVIGYAVKTCKRCRPIFVSPGHRISPQEALKAVLETLRGYKLPEPIRMAHILATEARRKVKAGKTLSDFF